MSTSQSLPNRASTRLSITSIVHDLSLHEAAWYGDVFTMKNMLKRSEYKRRIDIPDLEWGNRTALHIAADRGNAWFFVHLWSIFHIMRIQVDAEASTLSLNLSHIYQARLRWYRTLKGNHLYVFKYCEDYCSTKWF